MRISDWSSDVCSSDLREILRPTAGSVSCFPQLRPGLGPHGLEHRAIRLNRILSVAGHDHDFATKPSGTARKLRSRCGNGISMPASRNAASIAKRRRTEEHTAELQSRMRFSYAVVCLKKKQTYTSRSTLQ